MSRASRRGQGRRAAPRGAEADAAAEVVERLAVLLDAGIAPVSAWGHAAASTRSAVAREVAAGLRSPVGIPAAVEAAVAPGSAGELSRLDWLPLAACWRLVAELGAPMAASLRALAEALRDLGDAAREIEAALAGPRSSARIVLAMPPLGLLLAGALGIDALGALVSGPAGWACALAGSGLLLAGRGWMSRLVAEASRSAGLPGLPLELAAIAASGGAAPDRIADRVTSTLREAGLPGPDEGERRELEALLELAAAAGIPVGSLLRGEAAAGRRRARSRARGVAAQLGARLMLPLGLCVLPSFIALGVAPVVLALLSSTGELW
ncbi:type II secretion system F family protein [Homoserinibacter sp. YIM 151385]|uniref:type II secretion system F family protein n=1 Tax=Homoserinibacter sp. YIM 151385 TaxID=2985506 RepID=UPI0022F0F651|nr:type II secretion system F family protein [Homoserinibacter sp. YIM 151385]WBU36867.1 hypothetical protein OF852_07940 [Homoserinibacter sp. YIM 151385]